MEKHNICSIDDRAAQTAKTLWLKTKTEFTGNWHIDLDDQAIIVNAFAAELSKAKAEIDAARQLFLDDQDRLRNLNAEIARLRDEIKSAAYALRVSGLQAMDELRAELAKVKP